MTKLSTARRKMAEKLR